MDTINDNLSLTVINDGDGSQCGYSYKMRCQVFASILEESGKAMSALRMVKATNEWMIKRGYTGVSAGELLDQALKVLDYYLDHLEDFEKGANDNA